MKALIAISKIVAFFLMIACGLGAGICTIKMMVGPNPLWIVPIIILIFAADYLGHYCGVLSEDRFSNL